VIRSVILLLFHIRPKIGDKFKRKGKCLLEKRMVPYCE
jgi:hypothetical protein